MSWLGLFCMKAKNDHKNQDGKVSAKSSLTVYFYACFFQSKFCSVQWDLFSVHLNAIFFLHVSYIY